MPISYSGILEEHNAVRNAVGMFDLSHMGQFIATGDDVPAWLDTLTANEVGTMRPNQARYNIFTNERGGAHDDVIIYRLSGRWLVVVNASNTEKIWQLVTASLPSGITISNRTPQSALIALQGPRSAAMIAPLCDADLSTLRYYYATEGKVCGVAAEIARTGYTGEDGFEVFLPAQAAVDVWEQFTARGAQFGLRPAGLGARDMLRLEAGMPLYGHELEEDISPLAAGLAWAVKLSKPAFTGKAALEAQRAAGDYDRIVGLIMEGKAPARAGYAVVMDGQRVGEVRSGSPAPSLGGKNIATALVRKDASAPGTSIAVDIRGTPQPAAVVTMPFYKRPKPKM